MSKQFPGVDIDAVHGGRMGNRTGRDLPATVRDFINKMTLAVSRKQLTQEQAMQEVARYCFDGSEYVLPPAGWKLVPIEPTDDMLLALEDGDPDADGCMLSWQDYQRAEWANLLKHIPEFISHGDPSP